MAQQTILTIPAVEANSGEGTPLAEAFRMINENFTELYTDESQAEVNSVTGSGGLTASPTTGTVVVSLNDDSITYAKLGTEFTTSAAVGATTLDFSTAQVFTKANSGTVTYTISNAEIGMVKDLILTGTGSFSITGGKLIAGEFVESDTNFIQIVAQSSSTFWYSISQEQ